MKYVHREGNSVEVFQFEKRVKDVVCWWNPVTGRRVIEADDLYRCYGTKAIADRVFWALAA